ncbi:hypothetical protein [Pseudomonas sp. SCB32]|uniref:hypothetical protein n=1 Tax=Pseudomonas sp. SCB32 TaxID=2653853 RepID=UPI001264729D|nr:hypothetical protein [Pseudomonas sp. SCB32]HCI1915363.1 hypothetical protein [Pseudomonas aeruginosa]
MSRKRRKDLKHRIAEFEADARRLAGEVTEMERRIIAVGLERGKELEPVGRLAGANRRRSI